MIKLLLRSFTEKKLQAFDWFFLSLPCTSILYENHSKNKSPLLIIPEAAITISDYTWIAWSLVKTIKCLLRKGASHKCTYPTIEIQVVVFKIGIVFVPVSACREVQLLNLSP